MSVPRDEFGSGSETKLETGDDADPAHAGATDSEQLKVVFGAVEESIMTASLLQSVRAFSPEESGRELMCGSRRGSSEGLLFLYRFGLRRRARCSYCTFGACIKGLKDIIFGDAEGLFLVWLLFLRLLVIPHTSLLSE